MLTPINQHNGRVGRINHCRENFVSLTNVPEELHCDLLTANGGIGTELVTIVRPDLSFQPARRKINGISPSSRECMGPVWAFSRCLHATSSLDVKLMVTAWPAPNIELRFRKLLCLIRIPGEISAIHIVPAQHESHITT